MMEKLSIKSYAARHKLSIFNVVKMTKSGKLQTETEKENGKDVVYILIDEDVETEVKKAIVPNKSEERNSLRKENERLKKEIKQLKEEIAALKNRV